MSTSTYVLIVSDCLLPVCATYRIMAICTNTCKEVCFTYIAAVSSKAKLPRYKSSYLSRLWSSGLFGFKLEKSGLFQNRLVESQSRSPKSPDIRRRLCRSSDRLSDAFLFGGQPSVHLTTVSAGVTSVVLAKV